MTTKVEQSPMRAQDWPKITVKNYKIYEMEQNGDKESKS